MIYKSYLIEKNNTPIKNHKSVLFYGENLGLKNYFKKIIKEINKDADFINFFQDELLTDNNKFFRETENSSLFEKNKIIFINNCNDKILKILENYLEGNINHQVIIFAEILDKKSKLRSLYEKSKNFCAVACYLDNTVTIHKLINERLKNYEGLTGSNINMICEASSLDRDKLNNEINKIESFFLNKKIKTFELSKLLNIAENENFNELKDEIFKGNKPTVNNLINKTVIDADKVVYYLNLINQRLLKLNDIITNNEKKKIEDLINELKPPIFWKDKPNFIDQAKKWKPKKISEALKKTNTIEIEIKTNSKIDKKTLMKKLFIDLCNLANAS